MQRRPLMVPLFIISLASLYTVALTDCTLGNVTCTEYIVKSKPCLNLSGCMNYVSHTSSVAWYRCESTALLTNDPSAALCQGREVISTEGRKIYVTAEGRLCFSELNKAYSGLYCYEIANSTCNPVQVVVVEKPKIKAVSNVTVVTGAIVEQNIAMLQCDRPVEGCPATIRWKYKEHTLSNTGRFTIITTPTFTRLIIRNVGVDDGGIYECEVLDGYDGKEYTEQISLIVSNAVTQVINTSLCSDQQLMCNDLTNNPNPVYQWSHNHEVIDHVNHSLNLLEVKPTDFGLYHCWLRPSPYGSVVTQLQLVQTAVPLISDYVFLLIHHQNHSHLDINKIGSYLQVHVNNLCDRGCCDVTIVMELSWPCQCDDSTSVYAFKMNGTLAVATHMLLEEYFTNRTTVHEGALVFSMCDNHCCELCDYSGSHDESNDKTELALTVTMAALIAILLAMMIIILLSYQWYRKRATTNDEEHVPTVGSHGNNINGHVQIGINRDYDRLMHHCHGNTSRANTSYESLA